MSRLNQSFPSIDKRLPPFSPLKITSVVDRYGFSSILAERCGRHYVPRSFANWIHGWVWHDEPTAELLACATLPRDVTVVVANEREQAALSEAGFLDVRIGGLPFSYVKRRHQTRYADSLLAFPPHSAESANVAGDQTYLDFLESMKGNFESIYVSIYYLDMNGATHRGALARGLRVIPGARPDDANSLIRVRAILDSFEYVTSNVMGSHMLYALYAGCTFSFCGPIYVYTVSDFLGSGNPHRSSLEYVRQLQELHSETYLRGRFGKFFVENPRLGVADIAFAEEAIGVRFNMEPSEIESALGWGIAGQVRGYLSGARRRIARLVR